MIVRSLAMVSAAGLAASSFGLILGPGDNVPQALTGADVFSDSPTLLASNGPQGFNNASISGTVTSAVYLNGGGTLDFYVQVTVNSASADPVNRITLFNFGTYFTNVGYRTTAYGVFANAGTVQPATANRNSGTVGFNFNPTLGTSTTSRIMVIRTNATAYNQLGNVGVINGITENVVGFQPVPEPATLAGLGIATIALIRRRRR